MVGYNLYLIPLDQHPDTGDSWEGEPIYLHLSYGSWNEAEATRRVLQPLYGASGRVEVDIKTAPNTYMPGEGA